MLKQILKVCLALLIGGLIFLIIGEVICTMFTLSNDTLPVDFVSDPYLPYRLKPDFRAVSLHGIPININSLGLRDYEYSTKKEKGVYRILVLGDSSTLGHGVRLEDVYSKKLEQMLNKAGEFEVINAGTNGYNTKDMLQYLVHYGLKLGPDMIIVGLMENDFTLESLNLQIRDGVGIQISQNLNINPKIKKLLRKSHLYVFLAWAKIQISGARRKKAYFSLEEEERKELYFHQTWPAYNKIFNKLLKLCQENRMPLVFVYLPTRIEVIEEKYFYPQWIKKIRDGKEYGYQFIDMLPYFIKAKNTKDADSLYAKRDPCHPSSEGHRLIAGKIFLNSRFQELLKK